MNVSPRYLLPLLALWLAVPVFAGDQDQLKCGVNQDRVWVYDTLTSMDVGARLKCNESVEIVSRVKGYVKIRSASGTEGYVPDSALPDLPALPDPDDKMVAASSPAASNAGGTSLAAAAKAAIAAANKPSRAVSTASSVATPAQAMPPSTVIPAVTPQHVAIASAQPPVATPAPVAAPVPVTPAVAANPVPPAAPVAAKASAEVVVPAPTAVALVANRSTVPVSNAVSDTTTARAPVKQAVSNSTKRSKPAPATTPSITPSPMPVKAPSAQVNEARLDAPAPARTYPVRDIVTPSRTTTVKTAVDVPIGAEYPDTEPENESADPACHTFFSAYGLSPSQFKWLGANRQKLYPSICPAPDLASVDFVVLFTHDSDTYNVAMPSPVHTDRAGFSDFNPLTEIDTALLSGPDADHARHEYVWVFRTRRGGFDPVKFSPRRRPQFSTESKGSARAIEDAFNYLQEQGTRLEASQ